MHPEKASVTEDSSNLRPSGLLGLGGAVFAQLGFTGRAWLLAISLLVPLLGLLGWQLAGQYDQQYQSRRTAVKEHVETAAGTLAWAHKLEKSGQITREQAQTLARQAISQMRYAGSEYFWINDLDHRIVMHPIKPELDGKDVSSMKDPNGVFIFQAFVAQV